MFGHLIDGTQAEYVRVPYAETSVYKVPDTVTNQQGVMLSDILPTGFEIGVQYGGVKPGDVVAVVGSGPVGLAVTQPPACTGPQGSSPSTWIRTGSRRPGSSGPPTA